jgi:hypothetical protein
MRFHRDGGVKEIVLQQTLGRTYNRVQPLADLDSRFEIETPTAVTAVYGTEFALIVEVDGTTRVAVLRGVVNVTARDTTVEVPAGKETAVRPEQPPALSYPARVLPTMAATDEPTRAPSSPPGLTRAAPPGQSKTAKPPVKAPKKPDDDKKQQPPGKIKTPEPPGKTRTPEPPGKTKTPDPPGKPKKPQPSEVTKSPKPPKDREQPKRPKKP